MSHSTRFGIALAVLAGVAVPVIIGCNVLQYQFCISNLTPYNLKEVDIVSEGSVSWGANQLVHVPLLPGQEQDIPGWSPGTYWVRAIFDVVDPCGNNFCEVPVKRRPIGQSVECQLNEVLVYNFDLPAITTTNLCLDYYLDTGFEVDLKILSCSEIYAVAHFEI